MAAPDNSLSALLHMVIVSILNGLRVRSTSLGPLSNGMVTVCELSFLLVATSVICPLVS